LTRQVDVAIIGTGSAALAAAAEVRRVTDNFVIISNGVYGTTCVRAGCMPSKVFIQGAQYYHQRRQFGRFGIAGADDLSMDSMVLLEHVRAMRAHFLEHTLKETLQYAPHIMEGQVRFITPGEIEVDGERVIPMRTVLATGSSPIIPPECEEHCGLVLTSDTLFEQERLPQSLDVMGLSVLGIEMAQAFARLGIEVTAHDEEFIGGLSDPEVNEYAVHDLRSEFAITLNDTSSLLPPERGTSDHALFVAMSRKANVEDMGLEECGIIAPGTPVLDHNPQTMQVGNLPLFVAGDVKLGRSILNEAVDEGKIAGYNAAHEKVSRFRRRIPLQIAYTEPVIAVAGKSWEELDPETVATGRADYDDQGRAKIIGEPRGLLRIYADRESGELLGAELYVPGGEHLAHMLAWIIDRRLTATQALHLPFYHPSLEEGIRSALRDLAQHLTETQPLPDHRAKILT
jgi:dihydrolipoamide dehydrogenase